MKGPTFELWWWWCLKLEMGKECLLSIRYQPLMNLDLSYKLIKIPVNASLVFTNSENVDVDVVDIDILRFFTSN